jgi:hypothetical protein
VSLASCTRRAVDNARVVVITGPTELDEQLVGVPQGTGDTARHFGRSAERIQRLNLATFIGRTGAALAALRAPGRSRGPCHLRR